MPPCAAAIVPDLEIVGRRRAAERHVEMRVHVDAAGEDVFAGRVDDPVGRPSSSAVPMVVIFSPSMKTSPL